MATPIQKELINPDSLYQSVYYTQAVRVSGGTTIHVAGQWSYAADGQLVGRGDFEAQARQTFLNLKAILAASGARPEDVVKINAYVVDYHPGLLEAYDAATSLCFGDQRHFAATLIGVPTLALDGMLFEVEAVAVIP